MCGHVSRECPPGCARPFEAISCSCYLPHTPVGSKVPPSSPTGGGSMCLLCVNSALRVFSALGKNSSHPSASSSVPRPFGSMQHPLHTRGGTHSTHDHTLQRINWTMNRNAQGCSRLSQKNKNPGIFYKANRKLQFIPIPKRKPANSWTANDMLAPIPHLRVLTS